MKTHDKKTKTYPKTITQSGEYSITSTGVYQASSTQKKEGKFKRFLKFVFIKNIELKLLAIGASIIMWVLSTGLIF
ncbi:MAG: hypothetical protein FWE22_02015 [Firmicutes bacterium]|nr:hypothetical protein [Bacillota bacterium]